MVPNLANIAKNLLFLKHQLWLLILTKCIKLYTKILESTVQINVFEYDLQLGIAAIVVVFHTIDNQS